MTSLAHARHSFSRRLAERDTSCDLILWYVESGLPVYYVERSYLDARNYVQAHVNNDLSFLMTDHRVLRRLTGQIRDISPTEPRSAA